MTNTGFIYKHFKGLKFSKFKNDGKEIVFNFTDFEDGELEGECFICGNFANKGVSTKIAIKKTFTDFNYCRNKKSEIVCECCYFAISYKTLRMYGMFCNKDYGTLIVNQSDYKDIILNNNKTPFIICVPSSGQKWLHYKAPVNTDINYLKIQFEDNVINCTKKEFKDTLCLIEYLLNNKITKSDILTGTYNHSKIIKIGIENFKKIEDELKQIRKTNFLELCVKLANGGKK